MKKNMWILLIVLFISYYLGANYEKIPQIKQAVETVLNPTLGALLNFNLYIGFIIIIALTSLVFTLSQKYLSDQKELKEIKKEQKYLQEEMKKYKDHPEKLLEFQKKQLEFFPRTFELTMKPLIYTSIPVLLLFRWFAENLHPHFGGWWFLWYFIGSMIFSTIFRKIFDVA